jgi:hypothetical protein
MAAAHPGISDLLNMRGFAGLLNFRRLLATVREIILILVRV